MKIADVLNSYFDSVTDSLDLHSWSTQTNNENIDALQNILKRFHNHPGLIKIKQLVDNQAKFFKLLQSWQKELDNSGFIGTNSWICQKHMIVYLTIY